MERAEADVAVIWLTVEEGKSKQGRFFMRNSLGMFADLNYGEDGFKISSDAKKSIATSLYVRRLSFFDLILLVRKLTASLL